MLENTINDDKTIAGGSGTMLAGVASRSKHVLLKCLVPVKIGRG